MNIDIRNSSIRISYDDGRGEQRMESKDMTMAQMVNMLLDSQRHRPDLKIEVKQVSFYSEKGKSSKEFWI
jgi:hypothetical protein